MGKKPRYLFSVRFPFTPYPFPGIDSYRGGANFFLPSIASL